MQYSYQFPGHALAQWDAWAEGRDLTDIAVCAEEAGFDVVSATDHPFPGGRWVDNGGHHAFDPFVALSFMASATTTIRVMTFLLVSGYRNPYLMAKSISSLDVLSRGRTAIGMGAGYQRREFAALGADFPRRGPLFDEAVAAMREAWLGEPLLREESEFPATGNVMLPRPRQRPGPPILIGGNSKAAMRRVAELGDGWLPFEQTAPMAETTGTPRLSADDLPDHISAIGERRAALGRDPHFEVIYTPLQHDDPARRADALMELSARLESSGVTHIALEGTGPTLSACINEIEHIGDAVIAKP
ncbi:TIGR03619 family F420-dependent LLM class oxidoreductase [Tomitella fengzijianii]|uniref:TIGR03619 family F420-dependent LLM class oxidoreductase n=1 Tax=Tomitella fengzijianii TaxID=2597660 RepID=A0A516X6X2_9ACTN|nr:TIGR03619 family F420-dependent LLM class oxidoreductase [Tomitella fengzijianii]QDQ98822.1 TIGR03619 family F420-dependent LLM class oxidoreductase [Tomitella fengzijianii]